MEQLAQITVLLQSQFHGILLYRITIFADLNCKRNKPLRVNTKGVDKPKCQFTH